MTAVTGEATPTIASEAWAVMSSQLTEAVDAEVLKRIRKDVVTAIAPKAAGKAPACFYTQLARIEIDADQSDCHDPAAIDPRKGSDRELIPVTWGMTLHECAHARFSGWMNDMYDDFAFKIRQGTITAARAAQLWGVVELFEEPRIEALQMKARPGDTRFLRMMFAQVIKGDVKDDDKPGEDEIVIFGPPTEAEAAEAALRAARRAIAQAVRTIVLVGGRLALRVITPAEANEAVMYARKIIDAAPEPAGEKPGTYKGLPAWQVSSHKGKPAGWPGYGTHWHEDTKPYNVADHADADGTRSGKLLHIVTRFAKAKDNDARLLLAEEWLHAIPDTTVPEDPDALKMFGDMAGGMFDAMDDTSDEIHHQRGFMENDWIAPVWTPEWVIATPDQRKAAEKLRDDLIGYVVPERAATLVSDEMPPGRLNTRQAVNAAADEARGAMSEAQPWRKIKRHTIPTPPIVVGLGIDVSGSMNRLSDHSREIAFRFHSAFSELPDCTLLTILAGEEIHQMETRPGMIAKYPYGHGQQRIDLALTELTTRLGLLRHGQARLVIIFSDAGFTPREETGTIALGKRLLEAGCMVLWLDMTPFMRTAASELRDLGAIYVRMEGTPEECAGLASERLIEVLKDTSAALRRSQKVEAGHAPWDEEFTESDDDDESEDWDE